MVEKGDHRFLTKMKAKSSMKLIMINGPMGVGKTTVGKYIAEKYAGTAFIDGDWCLDLHPFVGNCETKTMAIDNILHMVRNYKNCSLCKMIVLVWLMDEKWVHQKVFDGIHDLGLEIKNVTLICEKDTLVNRWNNDKNCEWRTKEWLEISLKSLPFFSSMENCIDTDKLNIDMISKRIMCEL
ncbi:shikimate kinase [Lachnospiraceae bacterium]|nr:shikimate kinase [Lachnospiraceae bacterium]